MEPIVNEVKVENGDLLKLTYEVIGQESYGLRLCAERHAPEVLVEIPDITANLLEMQRLIMLLSKCSVTPSTIYDVLEDYLEEAHSKE